MKTLRILLFSLALCGAFTAGACITKAPEVYTPTQAQAFYKYRVIKALDLVRDIAIDAGNETPPLIAEQSVRDIVEYHRSALLIIRATDKGWQPAVSKSLDELIAHLPGSAAKLLRPYTTLASAILGETL